MSISLRKVGIIGTGHVGSHVAFSLALQGEVNQLYMMDIDTKKAPHTLRREYAVLRFKS